MSDTTSPAKLGLGAPSSPARWHSRGYLPHFDAPDTLQFITFRLADSLPQPVLKQLDRELIQLPISKRDRERRKRIEACLDAGLGCCALKHPRMAQVMQDTLLKFDGDRYRLIAWCIMPNHVHVLIEQLTGLPTIVQSWKSYTGRWGLKHNTEFGLGIPSSTRQFWLRDYWDRYIRDEAHFHRAIHYIHDNPVKADLCRKPQEWPWSSAKSAKA